MTDNDTVTVLPKLSNGRFKSPNRRSKGVNVSDDDTTAIDPDVATILKPKKSVSFDILGMKHEPTEEESVTDDTPKPAAASSSWNWLIISLAFIVVVLIIVIVWYVLKENKEDVKPAVVPPGIMRPLMQRSPQMYQQMQRQHQVHDNSMNPNNRPQTEHLPIHTKSMGEKNSMPTKAELEATLKKLETIDEEPEPDANSPKNTKPKSENKSSPNVSEEVDLDHNPELDDDLSKKFYANLQQNITMDEVDSDNEEGRND
jgi:hypothetical protein